MTDAPGKVELSEDDLRSVARFAVDAAKRVLWIFEDAVAEDGRPRVAIEAAAVFAAGGPRTAALRSHAWAAFAAARETAGSAARDAAQAAGHAAAAAYLHPLVQAHQVKHILGAAAQAVRAEEQVAERDSAFIPETLGWVLDSPPQVVMAVLRRYPHAPPGGGRVGEIIREIDRALRG